jgi:hypothetical protein
MEYFTPTFKALKQRFKQFKQEDKVLMTKWIRMLVILVVAVGLMISFSAADQPAYAKDQSSSDKNTQSWSKWWQQWFNRFPGCGGSGENNDPGENNTPG